MDHPRSDRRLHRKQDRQQNGLGHVVLSVVGAILDGYLASLVGYGGVTGVNIYSIIVAIVGAVIVLLVYRAIATRT